MGVFGVFVFELFVLTFEFRDGVERRVWEEVGETREFADERRREGVLNKEEDIERLFLQRREGEGVVEENPNCCGEEGEGEGEEDVAYKVIIFSTVKKKLNKFEMNLKGKKRKKNHKTKRQEKKRSSTGAKIRKIALNSLRLLIKIEFLLALGKSSKTRQEERKSVDLSRNVLR